MHDAHSYPHIPCMQFILALQANLHIAAHIQYNNLLRLTRLKMINIQVLLIATVTGENQNSLFVYLKLASYLLIKLYIISS